MEFVEILSSETVCAFQKSIGKREELKAALIQFLIRGYEAGMDHAQVWGILQDGDDCIITQAKLPDEDERFVRSEMTALMSEVYYDCPAKSSSDAIERHKKRIRQWYDEWKENR